MKTIIKNARVVNRGEIFEADVLIENEIIKAVLKNGYDGSVDTEIDASGKFLIPGVIDDQVHFREPGLTHKGGIYSESRAAAAGGVTSFMEMPNTLPPTTTNDLLEDKFRIAAEKSLVNYSFYLGATNDNIAEIEKIDPQRVPGLKLFLGSSTGNMLVSKSSVIEEIFRKSPVLCAIHSEDDSIISANLSKYKEIYGDDIPFQLHPDIRSAEACFVSTQRAVELALKTNCRLHILHISTARELEFLSQKPISEKQITAEVCVHHLWFNSDDYEKYGAKIKWNPAIKTEKDRIALIEALKSGKIDIVATDHAPHTLEEKSGNYLKAPSGGPLVQHSLIAMLELAQNGHFTIEELVKYMCHNPAELFKIQKRGFIEENYYADLVLLDPAQKTNVRSDNILYKCLWSPFEGTCFNSRVIKTFVNGKIVYDNGKIVENRAAMELRYSY
jgi:dihydroorotase